MGRIVGESCHSSMRHASIIVRLAYPVFLCFNTHDRFECAQDRIGTHMFADISVHCRVHGMHKKMYTNSLHIAQRVLPQLLPPRFMDS